ncbi:MAG: hypothetical protein ACRDXD_07290 [Acidimicrobiia bacterium]
MSVTYRTIVLHLPATPLGLLPEGWAVEHRCDACREQVASDQLVAHARSHGAIGSANPGEPFPTRPTPRTMSSDPNESESPRR